MAGEQSSGTFTRVHGETDDLRARSRATVVAVQELGSVAEPSLPNAYLARRGLDLAGHRVRRREHSRAVAAPCDQTGG